MSDSERTQRSSFTTAEEYLRAEEFSAVKHEFVDGTLFAMAGGTLAHNTITTNLYSMLRQHLHGGPCKAFVSDVKVHIEDSNSFYYPDVVVTCTKGHSKSIVVEDPVLICEVLSTSTSIVDRREKVLTYKKIASLREYLIIHQAKMFVEHRIRNSAGDWDLFHVTNGELEVLSLSPCGALILTMGQIYDDVTFDRKSTVSEDAADYEVAEADEN